MNYIIRESKINDCKDIAHVVTIAWNETYKGIVPDWFLEQLKSNEKERTEKMIKDFDDGIHTKLVLEIDNKIVGFTNFGPSDDKELTNCGEIFALYILKEYKGLGHGKKMVEEATKLLKEKGFDKIIIACLKGNPSNEFYKHIGGKYIKDGVFKRLDLPENIYLFENI